MAIIIRVQAKYAMTAFQFQMEKNKKVAVVVGAFQTLVIFRFFQITANKCTEIYNARAQPLFSCQFAHY